MTRNRPEKENARRARRAGAVKRLVVAALALIGAVVLYNMMGARQYTETGQVAPSPVDSLGPGFEPAARPALGIAAGWFIGGVGYSFTTDTTWRTEGAQSLRLTRMAPASAGMLGTAAAVLPAHEFAGKRVRLKGFIRTKAVGQGYAGLWIRADKGTRTLAIDNMAGARIEGDQEWREHAVELVIDREATQIALGALLSGTGDAWFDDFRLEVDGVAYNFEVPQWRPSASVVTDIRRSLIPIRSLDPGGQADDLALLDSALARARIVLLGEATHGSREFFTLKGRLVRHLAATQGFGVFAIEANLPEARIVNEYVLHGRGDARKVLAGLGFWTWNTEEVLDLIEWMRHHNAAGRGRLEFAGFDLQSPYVAMDSVRAFIGRRDREFVDATNQAYARVEVMADSMRGGITPGGIREWAVNAARVFDRLEARRAQYIAAGADTSEVIWAVQCALVVLQGGDVARGSVPRDVAMANNLDWIASRAGGSTKVVGWAHNGHVSKAAGGMGAVLSQRHPRAVASVGFGFGDGEFVAVGSRGLGRYPSGPVIPGSFESGLRQVGVPVFALDLRSSNARSRYPWAFESHLLRQVGSTADPVALPLVLANAFDVFIYVDQSSPARSFGRATQRR